MRANVTANESDLLAQGLRSLATPMTSLHCASSRSARYCSTMRQAQNPTCPFVAAYHNRTRAGVSTDRVSAACRRSRYISGRVPSVAGHAVHPSLEIDTSSAQMVDLEGHSPPTTRCTHHFPEALHDDMRQPIDCAAPSSAVLSVLEDVQ